MSAVVGIDLGTTNTVVACVRDGRVHVLADEKGSRLLPSVVSFHPSGDVLVGQAAKTRRLSDAANTIASIKRLIGRPWDSEEIRLARTRFAFELREGPGQGALVVARGEAYTLPEISAFVLKRVRQIAEAALGEKVDKAVITVPAHFNELQRASTKVAGRVAGLEVLRILNEPTAAALAYGFGSAANERVAVYDYGGGTFDCSLLELSGNLYEVLATAGDTFLGGDDIDSAIADQMCSAFLTQHRYDPRTDPQAFEKLRAAAENIKIALSTNMQTQLDLSDVGYGIGGKALRLTFGMTQADLDTLAEPYVERTLKVTQDALTIARLSPSAFDRVVLVGGSTRMPLVRRRVEAFFGIPPMDRVNPDEVVAIGAAIQGAALAEGGRRSLPPPPVPGVIRTAQAEVSRALSATDEVATEVLQHMVVPDRKLPSVAPPKKISTVPPPVPPRRTLRPVPGSDDVTQEHPALRKDDSMTRADTLPGQQSRSADKSLTKGQTLASAQIDQSLSRAGGNTFPSPNAQQSDRSIAEPPSINNAPSSYTQPMLTLRRGEAAPPPLPTSTRPLPPPTPPPARSPGPPPAHDPFSTAPFPVHIGPLPTDDISLIVPDAANQSLSRLSPVRMPGGGMPAMPGVGPLPTEDISLIAPEGRSIRRGPAVDGGYAHVPLPPGSGPPPARGKQDSQDADSLIVPVGDPRAQPGWQPRIAPVLVDVTPRALVVEVVGGFTDTVIARNATIPCEHTRVFATGRDLQTQVHVRVAQGEAQHFAQNTLLGELELSGLRPAPRGDVTLSVTFELDADGTLQVRAVDTSSGNEARATMRLVAVQQSEEEIEEMIERSRSVSVTGG